MMNKKGLTFTRLLLYILFATILGFIIYAFILTYNELKKNNTMPESQITVIKQQQNTPTSFSAATYFSDFYWCFYDSNNFLASLYSNLSLNSTSYSSDVMPFYTGFAWERDIYDDWSLIHSDSTYYKYFTKSSSFSELFLGDCLYNSINYIIDSEDNHPPFINYFDNYGSSAIIFNIDNCPINYFNFSLDYTNSYWNQYVTLFFIDNLGYTYRLQFDKFVDTHIDLGSLLSFNSDSSSITKMIFFVNQSNISSGINYYPVASPYNYNYSSLASINTGLTITFDIFQASSDYQDGYNDGYIAGRNDVDNALEEYNRQLVIENSQLEYDIQQANSRIDSQQIVISSLQNQLDVATSNFKGFFFTLADVPFKTVSNILGFEVFGVNMFQFFTGILTALGIIWLIKKFLQVVLICFLNVLFLLYLVFL